MNINISGKNINISNYLRDIVNKKAGKLERYFKPDTEMQVTLVCDGLVLRGEEATGDMYSSIDAVLKKLERQMRKHRTKLERRLHESAFDEDTVYDYFDEDFEEDEPQLVRKKKFALRPMDVEDAIMQMDLLGHIFFVFRNMHNNEVNVLYKRTDGNYGLIEPQ